MRKLVTMRAALGDPTLLADALPGPSWHAWRVLLIAAMGEALDESERAIFKHFTGREREPGEMVETWLTVAGRRSGKSRAMAVATVYLATLCDWSDVLALGERGLALFLAPSEKQAGYVYRYASTIIGHVPMLAGLVTGRTVDSLSLSTGVDLEIQAANWRRARGGTAIVACLDETAFLASSEDSANRDEDIYAAVKPSLATTGGPMLLTSSPAQMEGIVYRLHKRHYGPQGDPRIPVVQAASRELNPKLSASVVDRAFADDPTSAESEWGGQFRQAVSAYLDRRTVERAVDAGIGGRHPLPGVSYLAFVDVAGGSGSDTFACCVGHKHIDGGREICVIDSIWTVSPPFDPDDATKRCSAWLAQWKVSEVVGDAYGGDWPLTCFARHGVRHSKSPLSKSEIYLHVLPLFTAGRARILDNGRLVDQLAGLRRKVGSGGRESVDHVRGAHDDLANAAAGVLWRLSPIFAVATVAPIIITQQAGSAGVDLSPLAGSHLGGGGEGNRYGLGADRFSYPAGGTW